MTIHPNMRNSRHGLFICHPKQPVLVKLASAAVVCWLLGMTDEQAMATISHVWMDGHLTPLANQAGRPAPVEPTAQLFSPHRLLPILSSGSQIGFCCCCLLVAWDDR
jgi:hypothetical protein